MPQGLRGRVALFGAGVVCCSGLVGCLFDEKGKMPPPVSKAKAGQATPPGAKAAVPDLNRPIGGSGITNDGGFQRGTVNTPAAGPATPNYTGGINAPVVPGNHGAGAPLPGQQPQPPIVPSVAPAAAQYPPVGAAVPTNFGSSNIPAEPTTARAAAPVAPATLPAAPERPIAALNDMPPIQPPAPPSGAPSDFVAPPTAPPSVAGPLAPAPFPPRQ